jgi:hypothetical protein
MTTFDYSTVAELLPTNVETERLPSKSRKPRRQPIGYGRFARAADAIRFAIEELPSELLSNAYLEVDETVFNCDDIRRLYESDAYPLTRRATAR